MKPPSPELAVFLCPKYDPGHCSARRGFYFPDAEIAMDRTLLKSQLERHEGLRLTPYRDTVGKLTIGYGRNLEDVGVSRDECNLMLDNDIDLIEGQLKTVDEYQSLDPVRQTVLVNMGFNMGFYGLMKFKKMWAAIARKDYAEAARQMLDSKWHRQVGSRAQELAQIMRTGEVQR